MLYDGLVNPLLLRLTSAAANGTSRNKSPAGQDRGQEDINRRLIEAARAGKTVVRLKGGDPFIFGRGSEEAAALAAAGIDFEVVPGVTAAVAAGEYAGLSFTHREYASAVAFVTGHERPDEGPLVARLRGARPISRNARVLHGPAAARRLVEALFRGGKPADDAGLHRELARQIPLSGRSRHRSANSPKRCGPQTCIRRRSSSSANASTGGRRSPGSKSVPSSDAASASRGPSPKPARSLNACWHWGASRCCCRRLKSCPPKIGEPVDAVLARLGEFDWLVFTSVNGVESFFGRLWDIGGDARRLGKLRIAAIGPATADRCENSDCVRTSSARVSSRVAGRRAAPHVSGKRVLWARPIAAAMCCRLNWPRRARRSRRSSSTAMSTRSFPGMEIARVERGEVDWIALGSPSIAESLQAVFRSGPPTTRSASAAGQHQPGHHGPRKQLGLPIAAEATTYTWDGLIDAIVEAETVK